MTDRKPKRFLIPSAVLATVLLCGAIWLMVEDRNSILRNGSEIVLRTQPIDPRDLLRGRYVILSFPAEQLPPELVDGLLASEGGDDVAYRDPLYVQFAPGEDGLHDVVDVSPSRPTDLNGWMQVTAGGYPQAGRMLWLDFPIDRYYAAEKLAPEIEARMRDGVLTEVVVALHEGRAQIKAFRQDGETVLVEPLY